VRPVVQEPIQPALGRFRRAGPAAGRRARSRRPGQRAGDRAPGAGSRAAAERLLAGLAAADARPGPRPAPLAQAPAGDRQRHAGGAAVRLPPLLPAAAVHAGGADAGDGAGHRPLAARGGTSNDPACPQPPRAVGGGRPVLDRVQRRDLAALAALAAGLALVLLDTPSTAPTAPDPRRGNLVAAVSAFTCAFMMIGLRWLSRATADGGAGAAAVVLGNVFAFASMLPWAVPAHGARPLDWALLGYLGVFQIGVAYKLLLSALRHVPALEASLLLFVEPVLSPVWAWLFHGERPGPWTLAGGALILMTTAWRGWSERSGPLPVTPPPE